MQDGTLVVGHPVPRKRREESCQIAFQIRKADLSAQSRKPGYLFAAVALTFSASLPARADDPLIHQLTPREVSRGEVLSIVGENFGSQQGRQEVVYSPKIDGHRRPGSTRMRVVSWSDTTIRVQVPDNLERAESFAVWVAVPGRNPHTNFMSFTVRPPAPPAEAAGGPRRPWLDRVHPDIGRPGGEVDLYGDFNKPSEASPRVILVNRHGVPVERVLETSIWTDRRIRITVPAGIMGDDYQVFVRWIDMLAPGADGHMRPHESNRLQLVVRSTDERAWERGNPRILTIEPAGAINAGGVVDILGEYFGDQGRKHIAITPYRYHPLHSQSDSPPVLQIISWSDTTIRARLPANLQSAEHYVFIYWGLDYEDRSNQVTVQVLGGAGAGGGGGAGILPVGQSRRQPAPRPESANDARRDPAPPAESAGNRRNERGPVPMTVPFVTSSGMSIDRVTFQRQAGSRILVLGGRRFGTVQGQKLVSLNRNGTRHTAQVISWGDYEVRVRVPANLADGEYRVLVYYDNSLVTSSNSQPLTLGDVGPPVVRRPPPPARSGRGRASG